MRVSSSEATRASMRFGGLQALSLMIGTYVLVGWIFDFALSADDMAELDALDRTNGTDRALERKWWRS